MAKVLVEIPRGVGPFQVDFPEYILDARTRKPAKGSDGKLIPFGERSCEGSLHVRPESTLVLTTDELVHIQRSLGVTGIRLIAILPEEETAAPVVVTVAPPSSSPDSDEVSKKPKK